MDEDSDHDYYGRTINDLPDEVLEYIMSLLPPYKDLENCMLVCKRWKKNVSNVIQHTKHRMLRSLANFDVKWENLTPRDRWEEYEKDEKLQCITKRYSHSACFHENAMYVFGGCTCTSTTFNDFWKLDLSTRKWYRQLAMGTYPSPKACATLTYHDGNLLLFGGWTHPSPYPLHQAWRTFNELHIYDIATNRWHPVTTPTSSPPPMAGHSATIHKNNMVVFGGLHGQNGSSNDVWCFNLHTHTWSKQPISGVKPQSRYGQSQIALDDDHLLILGGCGGGNMNLNDIWLLNMSEPTWTWRQVTICNPQWAASHLWCHPACRVGHYVVVFSRNPVTLASMFSYSKWRPNSQTRSLNNSFDRDPVMPPTVRRASESMVESHVIDRDVNVNGRRGSLTVRNPQLTAEEQTLPSTSSASSLLASSTSKEPSPSSSVSSLVENNVISVVNSLEESLLDQEAASTSSGSSKDTASQGTPLNFAKKPLISDQVKSDITKNVGISGDRNSLNINRFYNSSNNRKLEFLSPPHCSTGMAAFRDNSTVDANVSKLRERQLEALRRVEERLRNKNKEKNSPGPSLFSAPAPPPAPPSPSSSSSSSSSSSPSSSNKRDTKSQSSSSSARLMSQKMAMFVLDISCVLTDECSVSWLPVKSLADNSPDDMILYTLIPGNGELIMFGGIQKDALSINQQAQSSINITNIVSNSLHFITPPHNII